MPRRLWRWLWRAIAGATLLAAAAVVSLRFVNPPVTAFMVEARLAAWWQGRNLSIRQHWLPGSCVSDRLALAVITAEDQRFPNHWGFDFTQIADALAEAGQGEGLRGASTISQQTAKNLFLWPGRSWLRKGLEAALTVLLEAAWPKRRILEVYLNVAQLGPGIYGADAAARHYFGKRADDLTAAESALLAAVLPNPELLRADAPSVYVRERQRWILRHMPATAQLPGVAALLRALHDGGCTSASPKRGR